MASTSNSSEKPLNPLHERYASAEMGRVFSKRHRYLQWRRIWIALAESQHELGLPISEAQLAAMRASCASLIGSRRLEANPPAIRRNRDAAQKTHVFESVDQGRQGGATHTDVGRQLAGALGLVREGHQQSVLGQADSRPLAAPLGNPCRAWRHSGTRK